MAIVISGRSSVATTGGTAQVSPAFLMGGLNAVFAAALVTGGSATGLTLTVQQSNDGSSFGDVSTTAGGIGSGAGFVPGVVTTGDAQGNVGAVWARVKAVSTGAECEFTLDVNTYQR